MLGYVYHTLHTFRKVFTRHATWLTFCVVVLGFLGSTQIDGVSSLCRFWHLDTPGYLALLHFFRSSAWSLTGLLSCWWTFVWSQQQTVIVEGQAVLIGDHTMVAKDGRRMPGVVTLHQESETQSKPNYFRGHFWGAIGLLIGTVAQPFCLPLSLRLHQGHTYDNRTPQRKTLRPQRRAWSKWHWTLLSIGANVASSFWMRFSPWLPSLSSQTRSGRWHVRRRWSRFWCEPRRVTRPTSRLSALSIPARVGRQPNIWGQIFSLQNIWGQKYLGSDL